MATDEKTLDRREVFSAYQAVVKESTRAKQQLRAMLNEHCVRLEKGFRLCHPRAITRLLQLLSWTPVRNCCCKVTLYGVISAVGEVHRFTHSKKLVAYFGLNPSVSQSGNFEGSGALKRHGSHKKQDMRG